MIERARKSSELEPTPRNPHQELCEILGVDDSTSWYEASKRYNKDEVSIDISAINHSGKTEKTSINIRLFGPSKEYGVTGNFELTGSYNILPNGALEGKVFSQMIPGVGEEVWQYPGRGYGRKSRQQALLVVDFVKSKIKPPQKPNP